MKKCTKCLIIQPFKNFYYHPLGKFNKDSKCKKCRVTSALAWNRKHKKRSNKHKRNFDNKNPWYKSYACIKARCNYRKTNSYKYYGGKGIKCLITPLELKIIWFRDKAYNMDRPSVDRINNTKNYTLDNCRYIELVENVLEGVINAMLEKNYNYEE